MKLFKIFKILLCLISIFIVFSFLNLMSNHIRNSFLFCYIDYCIQGSEHYVINLVTGKNEEYIYIPKAQIKQKEEININSKEKTVNEIIKDKSEDITNQYFKKLTGYTLDDMLNFLDDTNPVNLNSP